MKNKNILLSQFSVVKPPHRVLQSDLVSWTSQRHIQAEKMNSSISDDQATVLDKLFHRYAVKDHQIATRYFECGDILSATLDKAEIYNVSTDQVSGANIQERTQFYAERAQEIFNKFYLSRLSLPDHLIHVTCTGYMAPSAPQILVARQDWSKDTAITHAYHMGCYAALPAIRMAQGLAQGTDHQVDIVHTEMCGLHMNPVAHTPEQIIVQSLFADGHIKYSVSQQTSDQPALKVLKIKEKIVANSQHDMSWMPSPWGMQMTLSREVPEKIRSELKKFILEMAGDTENLGHLLKHAIFAIHPGGPKIINSVQEVFELTDEQVQHSKKVLSERGNMSSATLPHIWKEILDSNPKSGTPVVSFAFGPGLTIFGSVFEVK